MGLILLSNSKIQTFVGQLATVELSDRIGADVKVGSIEYKFFNNLKINNLDLYDQQGDTLCTIGEATVNFDFFKIFDGQFLVHKFALDSVNFQLRVDKNGRNNMQFLLDKLPKREKPFEGVVSAPDIEISHSNFTFSKQDSTDHWKTYNLTDIDGQLGLKEFNRDTLDAEISDFNLKALNSLEVENLTMHLQANRQRASLGNLKLKLPNSEASFDTLYVRYDSLGGLKNPKNWKFHLESDKLDVGLCDLSPFLPFLANNRNRVSAKIHLCGSLNDLRTESLKLNYNDRQLFSGSMRLQGLPNIKAATVDAEIENASITKSGLQDLVANFTKKPFVMPDAVKGLNTMSYQGHINGKLRDMQLKGLLTTNLGAVRTDARIVVDTLAHCMNFNGSISTQRFQLGQLIGNPKLGALSFSANTNMHMNKSGHVEGTVKGDLQELTFQGYKYHNIHADGRFTERSFDGKLTADSRELDMRFLGSADLSQKIPAFKFDLTVNHLRLHDMNLIQKYPMFDLSMHAAVNMSCNSLDNLNGTLQADSIRLTTENGTFQLNALTIDSKATRSETDFIVNSDIVDARAKGRYTYSTLLHSIAGMVQEAMPNLIPANLRKQLAKENNNNEMDFYARVQNADQLLDVLGVPVDIKEPVSIEGSVSDQNKRLGAYIVAPSLVVGKKLDLRNIDIQLGEENKIIHFNTTMQSGQETQPVNLALNLNAANDSARTTFSWLGADSTKYKGTLVGDILVRSVYGEPNVGITVQPSRVILADSLWTMSQSHITLRPDTTIRVEGFRFANSEQALTIDGCASRSHNDSIAVGLHNIDLGYWLKFVKLNNIWFGGCATGETTIYGAFSHPAFNANVSVLNASINDERMGNVKAHAKWSPLQQEVRLDGTIEDGGRKVADVSGTVATNRDSVDFYFDCDSVNLAFINAYTDPISLNIQGRGYGHLHLYKYPSIGAIRLVGSAIAKDASLGVNMLGTRYYIHDSIRLEKKRICFDSIPITDAEGHRGMVNGYLSHDGAFHNFKYHFDIDAHNILALNTTVEDNDFYYGHVYGTGKVRIHGDEDQVDINVNATTDPNSTFCISAASVSVAHESDFVRFSSKNTQETAEQLAKKKAEDKTNKHKSKLNLLLNVDATPDATLKCITDPKTNDMLTCRGNGNLRVSYVGDEVKVFGNYALESGSYSFTFQDVIHRDFKIERGSTINWSGDPLNGDVDITARYNTTANLNDLDATIAAQTSRKSVPVSCILHLTDKLLQPAIDFDIDLPNTEEGIKQQVTNLINTEELRNREVLYLLILNKFYKPDYMQSTTSNISQNDAYSLLTSTVTGQINNWISRLSSNFTVGLNIRTNREGDTNSQEYAGEFMYQPNPRLVINGNLGYRNDATSSNKLIADADIEYMLTRSGKLRAKAYTHTVDKYEDVSKDGTTKQGLGLIYRRDFNRAGEIFQRPTTKRSKPEKSTRKSTSK